MNVINNVLCRLILYWLLPQVLIKCTTLQFFSDLISYLVKHSAILISYLVKHLVKLISYLCETFSYYNFIFGERFSYSNFKFGKTFNCYIFIFGFLVIRLRWLRDLSLTTKVIPLFQTDE